MIKAVLPWKNPVADALAYAHKTGGQSRSDRSVTDGTVVAERWIAPPDLIQQMAANVDIALDQDYLPQESGPSISTIPMPVLMEKLEYPGRRAIEFCSTSGTNTSARVKDCDAYVSLLVPDPHYPFYRISLTGDELILECHKDDDTDPPDWMVEEAAEELLGIDMGRLSDIRLHRPRYSKILPISEDVRRDFIYWATDRHQVFSLGRFATWRPGLLLDDLVQDIRLIERWLDRGNRYEAARSR